jgi:hypothetical protein
VAFKVLNGLDLASQRIQNVADGSASTDAVTLQQLNNAIAGLAWKDSVRAATTTNGTLATAFANGQTIDGVALVTGDRILLKSQTTQSENGIYVVQASGAPVRSTDANTGSALKQATVFVEEGTTLHDTSWTCTNDGTITLGSSNLTFSQWGAGQTYSAGNGLQLSTNTFSVLANGTSIDVSGSGVKIADAAGGAGLTVASGVLAVGAGTGISVTADAVAIDTSLVARKYTANVGNGSLTSIAVTHNLGTQDVVVSVQEVSTHAGVIVDWVATDTNTVTLTFAVAPASNAYRCTVIG